MAQLIPSTTPIRALEDHGDRVIAVAVFHDPSTHDERMVTGSYDGMVRLWDLKTGKVLKKMDGHRSRVRALAVSRDGKWIASGDESGELIAWHGTTGEPLSPAIEKAHDASSVVRLHTSKLKVNIIRDYSCAASQSYQRLIMRQFNPAPYYEDSQFVFGATGAESAYTTSAEASSSAAEGGCSTPPTEYTPELETSELPYFAIDPTLLDDAHDPTSKKRKLDSLSSELEDHDANMPTFTGTHGRAGHPPTRRFQSPFLPASKKICTSNQKTSKIPIPSRLKVSTEIAAPIHASVPSSIRSSALSSIHSSVPSSIRSSALSSIHSSVPSSIRSSAPSSIRSTAPSSIRPTAPSRSNLPECLSTVVPRSTHPPQSIPQPSHGAITSKKQAVSEPQASLTPTRSFLVHKPIPLAFSKNTVTLSSRSKLPPVRDIPPVPQDDSDDVELNSGLLTRKSIGGSSKDKTMQGEILQLRKETVSNFPRS
ncbi:hypothetical protein DEU56DRAFT_919702 [Suillus clintonianus]|uniref:uncharacterized protein n=1 Tax=Suillus clintonianus TaxID=1904413 RepID=UPI001B886F92|nr:uncharacterized protein DEU56DRAFT_919702 [Suillus clintonianus]KAG2113694.1 hypothetical protein DEU56DRAFT_919702 [Suillus clintonianus]